MIGYVDMWFSSDGATWHQVNYEEGSGSNLYSSMEWALTEVDNADIYLGKWGHRLLPWTKETDEGEMEPALYFLAGDAAGDGSFVSDVFVSTETLFCSLEGIVCGGVGTCTDYGCTCTTTEGDFCTVGDSDSQSAATRSAPFGGFSSPSVTVAVSTLAASALLATQRTPRPQ
ncbi:unnamed protein product [Sphacelaria rigidula]